jgi:hypothetical protein
MMEQKIIYARNGDIGGNKQIIAIMEQKYHLYEENGAVRAKEQKYSSRGTKKYHLYEEQFCREQGTNYSGRGTKYHLYDDRAQGKIMAVMEQKKIIYIRNRYVEGKEQITAVMERNIIYMSNGDGTKIIICVWNR